MIDVRKLRMLAELDRLGTVAAVAEELRLTAPGVSMQLAALERELDVTLTERRGRRLALTPAGKLLAGHGRDLVDRLSLAALDVDALRRGVQGTYRLAAFPSAARTLVADAWRALRDEHADIGLRLSTPEPEAALAALAGGEVDLALVHSYSNVPRRLPDGLAGDPIAEEPVWLALRTDDPLAADTVDLAALSDRDWVMPTSELSCFEMVERACGLAGFRPRVVAETLDFAVQLELVAAGVGCALVPDLTVAAVPAGVRVARPNIPVTRSTHAVRRVARLNDPGIERILRALVDAAAHRIRTAPPA